MYDDYGIDPQVTPIDLDHDGIADGAEVLYDLDHDGHVNAAAYLLDTDADGGIRYRTGRPRPRRRWPG